MPGNDLPHPPAEYRPQKPEEGNDPRSSGAADAEGKDAPLQADATQERVRRIRETADRLVAAHRERGSPTVPVPGVHQYAETVGLILDGRRSEADPATCQYLDGFPELLDAIKALLGRPLQQEAGSTGMTKEEVRQRTMTRLLIGAGTRLYPGEPVFNTYRRVWQVPIFCPRVHSEAHEMIGVALMAENGEWTYFPTREELKEAMTDEEEFPMEHVAESVRDIASRWVLSHHGDRLWVDKPVYNRTERCWAVSIHSRSLPDDAVLGEVKIGILSCTSREEMRLRIAEIRAQRAGEEPGA